jgi:hypothetical protein
MSRCLTVMIAISLTAFACSMDARPPQVSKLDSKPTEVVVSNRKGPYIAEGYPKRIASALTVLNARDATEVVTEGRSEYVIRRKRRWSCGSTVTVAFKGGSKALRAKIASATDDWTALGNIKLDFGDASSGYRDWSPADTEYVADIRISFDDPEGGYWSLVGRDSRVSSLAGPGQPSMNYQDFDKGLPSDWRATVLHEFGHALGFEHEHQHPRTGCDFRWDDDPGYEKTQDEFDQYVIDANGRRPGIYTVMGGPPNEWSSEDVDFNLRKLRNTRAFRSSRFVDKESIMKYFYEDWLFEAGAESPCYFDYDNATLSPKDGEGIAWAYPASCPD